MPNCLIVASHFPPFRSAGVFRTIRVARYLPEHGWSIEVLTVDPKSYLAGSSQSPELLQRIPEDVTIHRAMAVHPLQVLTAIKSWKPVKKGSRNGQSVVAAKSTGATTKRPAELQSDSFPQRIKDAITVPLMTPDRWIGWLPFAVRKGRRILNTRPADVIYSSGPPWTNHLVAEKLQRHASIPWVADFRDPWLGNNFRPRRQGDDWVGKRHQLLEKRVIEAANVVILNTERSRQSVLGRYSELPPDKFVVINNGFDPADFGDLNWDSPASTARPDENRPLRLVHTGAFYGKRNVDALIRAVGKLVQQGDLSHSDLRVDLIGAQRPGRTHESEVAESSGVSDMINVLPSLPHAQCLAEMSTADALLLVQTEAPLCIPGKVFEYIAVKKPVLTLAGEGATADLVAAEKLGPCVDPADSDQLATCLRHMVDQYRQNRLPSPDGSAAERYNGRKQIEQFDAALRMAMDASANVSTNNAHAS